MLQEKCMSRPADRTEALDFENFSLVEPPLPLGNKTWALDQKLLWLWIILVLWAPGNETSAVEQKIDFQIFSLAEHLPGNETQALEQNLQLENAGLVRPSSLEIKL